MRPPSRPRASVRARNAARQTGFDGLAELLDALRRLFEHARPTEHLMRRQRLRIAENAANALLERAQSLERSCHDRVRRCAALAGADLQRAIDFAAFDCGRDELPAFRLDRTQLIRQAEAELRNR